jgi:hypothetical protein
MLLSSRKNGVLRDRYVIIKNHNCISSLKDEENRIILESRKCCREESNNIYDSNLENNEMTHNNVCPRLNEENKTHQKTESIPIEELFLKQKERVKLYKEKKDKMSNKRLNIPDKSIDDNKLDINNNINNGKLSTQKKFNNNIKSLTLENFNFFEKAMFQPKNKHSGKDDNIPMLKNVTWKTINSALKDVELKKTAIRTINEIDYEINMVQININFTLQGTSEFWIFTRCFVNKENNDIINFENSSLNNEPDIIFNKYSSLIKISKERYSSKCFVSFGTFCENDKDPNHFSYKTFLKRQLVSFNENVNLNYLEKDICEFYVYITDSGNENIDSKIAMNCEDKFNYVMGNFYLPVYKRSKLLFCGEGESIIVKDLKINNYDKDELQIQQFETLFSLEQKSCSCCNII